MFILIFFIWSYNSLLLTNVPPGLLTVTIKALAEELFSIFSKLSRVFIGLLIIPSIETLAMYSFSSYKNKY